MPEWKEIYAYGPFVYFLCPYKGHQCAPMMPNAIVPYGRLMKVWVSKWGEACILIKFDILLYGNFGNSLYQVYEPILILLLRFLSFFFFFFSLCFDCRLWFFSLSTEVKKNRNMAYEITEQKSKHINLPAFFVKIYGFYISDCFAKLQRLAWVLLGLASYSRYLVLFSSLTKVCLPWEM